jgi:putative transposase
MARLARLVVPGMPHHVTQRGNRRQQTFFNDGDYAAYLELMGEWCREKGVEIWSYCLMPNHVHLIAVPSAEDGLRRAIGSAHERYTRRINFREKWRGYLWQGRFASFVMDEPYLVAAARYVELNPVRAKLVPSPAAWPWSSARAHLSGRNDCLVKVAPLLAMIADWSAFLKSAVPEEELRDVRRHGRAGRPLGDETFLGRLEERVGHALRPQKRGPEPEQQANYVVCPWNNRSAVVALKAWLVRMSGVCI